ncbi:MAG: hypothetical protein KIT60_21650 [Burkholderiaceae bacterium]|nr:hypothetical protein [Burkholderiaceae bacterium]
MSSSAQDTPAAALGQWFSHWAEQQSQWAQRLKSQPDQNPFAALAAAMAAAHNTLPRGAAGAPAWSALPSMAEALLGRVDSAPTLAPLWDFDRKSATASAAWWRLQEAQAKYRALLDSVWPAVQKSVLERQAQALKQNKAATARESVDRWLDALNEALLELMRTPAYLKAQRDTLDAGLAYREALAAIASDVGEWLQLPTRAEVDDLARAVVELRREVRNRHRAERTAEPAPRKRAGARLDGRTR